MGQIIRHRRAYLLPNLGLARLAHDVKCWNGRRNPGHPSLAKS